MVARKERKCCYRKILRRSVFWLVLFDSDIVSGCSSDLDCSLNGLCVDQRIDRTFEAFDGKDGNEEGIYETRELPWSGENCETLRFLPIEGSPSPRKNDDKMGQARGKTSAGMVIAAQGYGMVPNITTWGGGILTEIIERPTDSETATNPTSGSTSTSTSTLYHLYVSRITKDCPLEFFTSNSRIDHAVSDTITGPYEFSDVAVPVFSHNPAPIELWPSKEKTTSKIDDQIKNNDQPSWKYALFHIGNGVPRTDGEKDCRDGNGNRSNKSTLNDTVIFDPLSKTSSSSNRRKRRRHLLVQKGVDSPSDKGTNDAYVGSSAIHVSESLYGPWVPLSDHDLGHCNNPSPWVHPTNGTLFVLCSNGGHQIRLFKSEHGDVAGPYKFVTEFFANTTTGGSIDHPPSMDAKMAAGLTLGVAYEDPFLYTDIRGNFHCIFHAYQHTGSSHDCEDTLVSAHAYSRDGYEWHLAPAPPYGSRVDVAVPVPGTGVAEGRGDGTTGTASVSTAVEKITLATRERPKLVFGDEGGMTHMVQGVCGSPGCEDTPYGPFCCECKYRQWDFTLVSALDLSS